MATFAVLSLTRAIDPGPQPQDQEKAEPHLPQKREPAGEGVLQLGQTRCTGCGTPKPVVGVTAPPHFPQNFVIGGFQDWQRGHCNAPVPAVDTPGLESCAGANGLKALPPQRPQNRTASLYCEPHVEQATETGPCAMDPEATVGAIDLCEGIGGRNWA